MPVPNSPYFHVIMPLGADPQASKKREIIRSAASHLDLEPHFPSYSPNQPEFSLQSALSDMSGCLFVLADLSLERPSCYYELGLAEAQKVPVYLIAESGTPIHQTTSRDNLAFYRPSAVAKHEVGRLDRRCSELLT